MAGGSSPVESKTILFAIPGYSKLGQTTPGSPPTFIKNIYFRRHTWRVEVYSGGFDKGVPTDISVVVKTTELKKHSASGTTDVRIEILDMCWERAVFHRDQTLGSDGCWFGYLTVERSRLEEQGSLCNDNIPVKCTLTFLDLKKQRRQRRAAAMSQCWLQLRRRVASTFIGGVRKSNHVLGSSVESAADEVPASATPAEQTPTLHCPN